jgi:hypothetical protein
MVTRTIFPVNWLCGCFELGFAASTALRNYIVRELREKRDYHNARLKEFRDQYGVPSGGIFSRLKDEQFCR